MDDKLGDHIMKKRIIDTDKVELADVYDLV
jgi:hypothetical protein